jgi:hypothetical protein
MPSNYSKTRAKELLQTDRAKLFFLSLQAKLAMLPNASVPLYQGGVNKNHTPELIGTGFALHLGTHKMLITAGHVTDLLHERQFHVPNSGQLTPFNCRITRLGHAGVPRAEDPIDLTVIDLDTDQAARLSAYHFVGLSEIEYDSVIHDTTAYNAFMGYPESKNRSQFKANFVMPCLAPYVGVQIPLAKHEELNRPYQTHLGIPFDKNSVGFDGKPINPPSPKGLSGCPVWALGRIPEIVHGSRKPLFVGMGLEDKPGALIAVRAWLIVQTIRQLHKDLDNIIEAFPNVRLDVPEHVSETKLILTGQ